MKKHCPVGSSWKKTRMLLILLLLFGCFMRRFSHTRQKWRVDEELIKSKMLESTIHIILKWYQVPESHSIEMSH